MNLNCTRHFGGSSSGENVTEARSPAIGFNVLATFHLDGHMSLGMRIRNSLLGRRFGHISVCRLASNVKRLDTNLAFGLNGASFRILRPVSCTLLGSLGNRVGTLHTRGSRLDGHPISYPRYRRIMAGIIGGCMSGIMCFHVGDTGVSGGRRIDVFGATRFVGRGGIPVGIVNCTSGGANANSCGVRLSRGHTETITGRLVSGCNVSSDRVAVR